MFDCLLGKRVYTYWVVIPSAIGWKWQRLCSDQILIRKRFNFYKHSRLTHALEWWLACWKMRARSPWIICQPVPEWSYAAHARSMLRGLAQVCFSSLGAGDVLCKKNGSRFSYGHLVLMFRLAESVWAMELAGKLIGLHCCCVADRTT